MVKSAEFELNGDSDYKQTRLLAFGFTFYVTWSVSLVLADGQLVFLMVFCEYV